MINEQEIENFLIWGRFKKHFSERTVKEYRFELNLFLAYLEEQQLTEENLKRYVKFLEDKELKPATINRKICVLNAYIKYLREQDIEYKVLTLKKIDKEVTLGYLKRKEAERLIDSIHGKKMYRNRAIINTLLETGITVKELVNLPFDALQENELICKERKIKLPIECVDIIKDYIEKERVPSNYLFSSPKGTLLSTRTVQRIVKSALEYAGLGKVVTPKTFRGSFIAKQIIENNPEEDIVKSIGLKEKIKVKEVKHL